MKQQISKERIKHLDGALCLEGIRNIRRGYQICCKDFYFRTSTCVYDIRYQWYKNCWGISAADGGSSFIEISFCPHCGKDLSKQSKGKNLKFKIFADSTDEKRQVEIK